MTYPIDGSAIYKGQIRDIVQGTHIITVGASGDFADLKSAIDYRATLGHTDLGSFTGTVSGTSSGTVDYRSLEADAGTPFTGLSERSIGVRLDNSGPIVRFQPYGIDAGELLYGPDQDYSSVNVEIFDIKSAVIMLQSGHVENFSDVGVVIPAFTTISSQGYRTASINTYSSSPATKAFVADSSQNEIYFHNLNLSHGGGSTPSGLWGIPTGVMVDFGLIGCRCDTVSQDFVFFDATVLSGGFTAKGCDFSGQFDVIRAREHRRLSIIENSFNIFSANKFLAPEANCVVIGDTGAYTYHTQQYYLANNTFNATASSNVGPTNTGQAFCINVRNKLSSKAVALIVGNKMRASVQGGSQDAVCVKVEGSGASGETPEIIAINNLMETSNAGSGGNFSMDSDVATYTIERANNVIIGGSLGSNTAARAVF